MTKHLQVMPTRLNTQSDSEISYSNNFNDYEETQNENNKYPLIFQFLPVPTHMFSVHNC